LPDTRVRVNQILAERDLVVAYWTASGTNTRQEWGFQRRAKRSRLMAWRFSVSRRGRFARSGGFEKGHAFSHEASGFVTTAVVKPCMKLEVGKTVCTEQTTGNGPVQSSKEYAEPTILSVPTTVKNLPHVLSKSFGGAFSWKELACPNSLAIWLPG
jgi:hypothetical protein